MRRSPLAPTVIAISVLALAADSPAHPPDFADDSEVETAFPHATVVESFPIGRLTLSCGGTPKLFDHFLDDAADRRPGVIIINPHYLMRALPLTRIFIYAFACVADEAGPRALDADCLAIRTARNQGWLQFFDIPALQEELSSFTVPWSGAPGRLRISRLQICFDMP